MSFWAQKKQATYGFFVLLFLVVVVSIPAYYTFFHHAPTCFDGIQNQGEEGIDCGGPCTKVCAPEAQPPIVHWQLFFKVTDGVYNVVANVENPNTGVYATDVPYTFRLYDDNNVEIADRTGTAFMLPNAVFPIFEGGLMTGERVPVRATFEFDGTPSWQKKPYVLPRLVVIDQTLSGSSTPRVDATIQNTEDYDVSNIEVVSVIYDADGNAIAASDTLVDHIAAQSSQDVVFTWPQPFTEPVSKILITPKIAPRFDL